MKIKVADYIINYLTAYGIKDVFVVYGAANGDLIDAFVRNDDIKYVCTMHEQAGGFAAEAYAKVNNKLGVAIATSGPGGQNFVTSMGNCFYDSVPVLFITGQINSRFLRPTEDIRQIGFQETDIVSIAEPVTKYAVQVANPEDVKYELEKALYLATTGRPGPVLLDVPLDVQKAEIETDDLVGYDELVNYGYDIVHIDMQIQNFISDLYCAKRPAMLIGNGVKIAGAQDLLQEVLEILQIPAFPTWNAIDVVCSDNKYYGGRVGTYGGPGRNFGIQNCDLLLGVGTRLSGRITGGNVQSFAREAKKYVVDVDKHMLQKKHQQLMFDECILADAGLFLERLLVYLKSEDYKEQHMWWLDRCRNWKDKYDTVTTQMYKPNDIVHPYAMMRILSEEMSADDVILGDCGGNIVVMSHAFKTKTGQQFITNNGNSPMGFSFAASIGAQLAYKKAGQVVCVIGDGGFNMNIQELQTLVNYNLPIKVLLLNNHVYGITKAFQEVNFQGRNEACGPTGYKPPNFRKIVKAYDIPLHTIDNGQDYGLVRQKLRDFLDATGTTVLDVNCDEYHTYEPKIIGWNTPIEDMYPYLSDQEFNSNMYVSPLPREKFGDSGANP